jgi:predicted transcriptional regulator YdeE
MFLISRTIAASLLFAFLSGSVFAQAKQDDWTISPSRVIDAPAMTLFSITYETTFAQMNRVAGDIDDLFKALASAGLKSEGRVVLIYKGAQQDRSKPFTLTVGVVVPAGTKPVAKYRVTDLPAFHCAATLFNGGLTSIGAAYQKHYTELFADGQQPTDESREVYLHWEGSESNNNVVWIQAGVR